MSIEKKSLISTLKTTKKANAVSSELAKPTNVTSKKTSLKRAGIESMRRAVKSERRTRRAMQD